MSEEECVHCGCWFGGFTCCKCGNDEDWEDEEV